MEKYVYYIGYLIMLLAHGFGLLKDEDYKRTKVSCINSIVIILTTIAAVAIAIVKG